MAIETAEWMPKDQVKLVGPHGAVTLSNVGAPTAKPEDDLAQLGRLAKILEEDSRLSRPSDEWNARMYRVACRPAVISRLIERVQVAEGLIDEMAANAARQYEVSGIDLVRAEAAEAELSTLRAEMAGVREKALTEAVEAVRFLGKVEILEGCYGHCGACDTVHAHSSGHALKDAETAILALIKPGEGA